jgi:hypothetical protein
MTEHTRRDKDRVKTGMLARAHYEGGETNCVVADYSRNGAMLHGPVACVPEDFDLVLERDGIVRRARVVWRSGPEIGVAFLKA